MDVPDVDIAADEQLRQKAERRARKEKLRAEGLSMKQMDRTAKRKTLNDELEGGRVEEDLPVKRLQQDGDTVEPDLSVAGTFVDLGPQCTGENVPDAVLVESLATSDSASMDTDSHQTNESTQARTVVHEKIYMNERGKLVVPDSIVESALNWYENPVLPPSPLQPDPLTGYKGADCRDPRPKYAGKSIEIMCVKTVSGEYYELGQWEKLYDKERRDRCKKYIAEFNAKRGITSTAKDSR